jgi:PST family polysaccharide transporter
MPSDATEKRPEKGAIVNVPSATGATTDVPKTSYGQILKSSAWIGGSSVLTIGIGVVRTKAMAVMLLPAGLGLMGLYNYIIVPAMGAAGMGIANPGCAPSSFP